MDREERRNMGTLSKDLVLTDENDAAAFVESRAEEVRRSIASTVSDSGQDAPADEEIRVSLDYDIIERAHAKMAEARSIIDSALETTVSSVKTVNYPPIPEFTTVYSFDADLVSPLDDDDEDMDDAFEALQALHIADDGDEKAYSGAHVAVAKPIELDELADDQATELVDFEEEVAQTQSEQVFPVRPAHARGKHAASFFVKEPMTLNIDVPEPDDDVDEPSDEVIENISNAWTVAPKVALTVEPASAEQAIIDGSYDEENETSDIAGADAIIDDVADDDSESREEPLATGEASEDVVEDEHKEIDVETFEDEGDEPSAVLEYGTTLAEPVSVYDAKLNEIIETFKDDGEVRILPEANVSKTGSHTYNEDVIYTDYSLAMVMDGATSITGTNVISSEWVTNRVTEFLPDIIRKHMALAKSRIAENTADAMDFVEVSKLTNSALIEGTKNAFNEFAKLLDEDYENEMDKGAYPPSSTLLLAYPVQDKVVLVSIGDSNGIVYMNGGGQLRLRKDNVLTRLDSSAGTCIKALADCYGLSFKEAGNLPEINAMFAGFRSLLNTEEGYVAVAPGMRRLDDDRIIIVDADKVDRILFYTDGCEQVSEKLEAIDSDVEATLSELRILEENDPDYEVYPRFKKADDATALRFEVI